MSRARHVAVFAFPFGSHTAPLFSIVHKLAIHSPTTHFSFFSLPVAYRSVLSSYEHNMPNNIKVHDLYDGVPDGYKFTGKPQEDIELFLNSAAGSFRTSIDAAVAEYGMEIDRLLSDAFLWFVSDIAEELKVPWVACWTSASVSISAHFYTDLIRDTFRGKDAVQKDECLGMIPGMSRIRIGDLPDGVLFGNLESAFSKMLHNMAKKLPKAEAIFTNSCEELEPFTTNDLKSKFKNFLTTGLWNIVLPPPLEVQDTYGCLPWLDMQKPASVIYFAFGTIVTPPPHELAAIAEALEDSKMPFIWSIKDQAKANLPSGFLARTELQGLLVPWTPQKEVLGHGALGVFVTHGGWNSVTEAIAGGVPMICRPFLGDHIINARMIEDVWEIGVKAKGGILTRKGLIDSFDQVIHQEKGNKMRHKVKELKELAKSSSEPNGSTFKNFNIVAHLVTSPKY